MYKTANEYGEVHNPYMWTVISSHLIIYVVETKGKNWVNKNIFFLIDCSNESSNCRLFDTFDD